LIKISRGIRLLGSIGTGNKKYTDTQNPDELSTNIEDEKYFEIMSDVEIFVPIAIKNTIKIRNLSGFKKSNNLYENELFRIGGIKSLRGFEEESFTAAFFSITSLEYRYLFEKNSAFYLFFDYGYYSRPFNNLTISDTPFGFGLGVDFETRAGIFTLIYALGRQQSNPIEFNSGKIYFGIVNRF